MILLPEYDIAAIADGTGAGGRAADELLAGIRAHVARHGQPGSPDELEDAVRSGELALTEIAHSDSTVRGAGTTLDIVCLVGTQLFAIHVGDGRIYHLRRGTEDQLSMDHTWVHDEVAAGRLAASESPTHPLRNVITRAFLGGGERVSISPITVSVDVGDIVVLCTDGVWKSLPEATFLGSLRDAEAIERMFWDSSHSVRQSRTVDNATIVVAEIFDAPAT